MSDERVVLTYSEEWSGASGWGIKIVMTCPCCNGELSNFFAEDNLVAGEKNLIHRGVQDLRERMDRLCEIVGCERMKVVEEPEPENPEPIDIKGRGWDSWDTECVALDLKHDARLTLGVLRGDLNSGKVVFSKFHDTKHCQSEHRSTISISIDDIVDKVIPWLDQARKAMGR